ncbi:hypothetical protein LCGC14_1636120 [marine sediment metagenome]|uniref:Uncharacterized protein n=1 Tax=marine sediment metagenome TaxID=412755 RepID=A0A0F9I1H3_9ZZZZ
MSTIVERLAKKSGDALYGEWGGFDRHADVHRDNARWWLNAIAAELEDDADQHIHRVEHLLTANHLRTQAGEAHHER